MSKASSNRTNHASTGATAADPLADERLLSEGEAAAFLGFGDRALQNWRLRGGGPLFVKVSARAVRYRLCDLRRWASERLRASTSDADGNAAAS